MRSARIRTAWKDKRREISVEEHAAAVAAVAWRVALNAAKNLHEQDFIYDDDAQRLGVIREYLYFFIHIADRRARATFADSADSEQDLRARFITRLSRECRRHYRENEGDILAGNPPGALPAGGFIAQLNRRMDGYANTRFTGDEPGYDALRALGLRVQDCMGRSQTNKWAQDQVLEIDGPEAARIFRKALAALNAAAGAVESESASPAEPVGGGGKT